MRHDTRLDTPAIFWWWDDALREARWRATLTRHRMTVKALGGMWRVAPEGLDVEEACS